MMHPSFGHAGMGAGMMPMPGQQMTMGGPASLWVISFEERAKSNQHFATLCPVNGFITGEQARGFMTQSGLPPNILAQIWSLADLDKDGRMNEKEFSIAMHLIQKRMAGVPVPQALPPSMVADPVHPVPMGSPQAAATWHAAAPLAPMAMPHSGDPDWNMSQAVKLKHSQTFNQLDKNRVGHLTGAHARNILSSTGLPMPVLAQIWTLSDLDKDGKLTCDEFCIAMYLADMAKMGVTLPKETPAQLRSSATGGAGSADASHAMNVSFEDKRKQNFSKGQAELERRRQILMEQEKNERERREAKEREQRERLERERLEHERRRQLEMEKEAAKQREMEAHRQEEQRKLLEQREAARREMEKQRKQEMEKQRIKEMNAERERSVESMCHTRQKQKNLTFQLQALTEKSQELNNQITSMREKIVGNTSDIDSMKQNRDGKLSSIESLKLQIQEAQYNVSNLSSQRLSLQQRKGSVLGSSDPVNESLKQVLHSFSSKQMNMETLRASLAQIENDLSQTKNLTGEREEHLQQVQQTYMEEVKRNEAIYERLDTMRVQAAQLLNQSQSNGLYNGNDSGQVPPTSPPANAKNATHSLSDVRQHSTVKYRALYEFVARGPDELTFQPGDTILVFKDHDCEPGWLAGQIRDKVGWFPEAFAEPANAESPVGQPNTALSATNSADNLEATKLEDIKEEEEKGAEGRGSIKSNHSNKSERAASVEANVTAIAQFPYKGKKESHLSFVKGDVIKVRKQEEMWWEGELNGKVGWFLKSYVRLEGDNSNNVTPVRTPEDVASLGEWFVSVYEFPAQESTDLSFVAGERILVIKKDADWWTGTIGEKTGIFPANYVQKEEVGTKVQTPEAPTVAHTEHTKAAVPNAVPQTVVEPPTEIAKVIAPFQASSPNQLNLQQGDMIRIRTKSPTGWWEGELQRKGQDKRLGWFPGNYVKILGSGSGSQPSQPGSTRASVSSDLGAEQVQACFDYQAQQDDELNFTAGDIITILEKVDADWWKGKSANGQEGIFPANYVQPVTRVPPTTQMHGSVSNTSILSEQGNRKRVDMHRHEFLETEQHYLSDLKMVDKIFRHHMKKVLPAEDIAVLFGNWDQLMRLSKDMCKCLKDSTQFVGRLLMDRRNDLEAFVIFCQNQKAALNLLEVREKMMPEFRAACTHCSKQPAARGHNLTNFLLLPMTRVTKYPLMIEKILKYCDPTDPDRENLQKAYEMVKGLCSQVNQVVTDVENVDFLQWCETHVNCEGIIPKLSFQSNTNFGKKRNLLLSGILFKARSNRLLVALLFNDFLMLCTPDEQIDHPDSFKLNTTCDIRLTVYKSPILLHVTNVLMQPALTGDQQDKSGKVFALRFENETVTLKAVSNNAHTLWTREIEKAIKSAKEDMQAKIDSQGIVSNARGIGRLLIELVCIRQLTLPPNVYGIDSSIICVTQVGNERQCKRGIDINRKDSLFTTQMTITNKNDTLHMTFYLQRLYCPDLRVGGIELSLGELMQSCGAHRVPVLKQIGLTDSELESREATFIILKFVVQMFD